jgi:glycine/serine hydroxymethyltransferase
MGAEQMEQIAAWINDVLRHPGDGVLRLRIADDVRALCAQFPLPST